MDRVRVDDVENDLQPTAVMRKLTGPLGLTDLGVNYYELEPGDSFSFAYHSHGVQEEVFYVMENSHARDGRAAPRLDTRERWNRERGGSRRCRRGRGGPVRPRGVPARMELRRGSGGRAGARRTPGVWRAGEAPGLSHLRGDDGQPARTGQRGRKDDEVVPYCEGCRTETGRWYRGSMNREVEWVHRNLKR